MKRYLYIFALCLLALSGCGIQKKTADILPVLDLPSRESADSLVSVLVNLHYDARLVFPVQQPWGARIYAVLASRDSSSLRIIEVGQKGLCWSVIYSETYPCFCEDMRFIEYDDFASMRAIDGENCLFFGALSKVDNTKDLKIGSLVRHSTILYNTGRKSLSCLNFTGRFLPDGRIEGMSDSGIKDSLSCPHIDWLSEHQKSNPRFVFISEADVMTDQAIGWWVDKNPEALTNATSIVFGALPKNCSLVYKYINARGRHVSAEGCSAAMFDFRGYTVVVAKRYGKYILVWAEPVCTNRVWGRLLNSIYFEQDNSLVLFYYQGKSTFKYRLNLANGNLMR